MTTEIKCYIEGCYTYGKPDYGSIRIIGSDKLVYVCDYGVTLTENAKRCAEKNNWSFVKKYYDKVVGDMVLVFKLKEKKK